MTLETIITAARDTPWPPLYAAAAVAAAALTLTITRSTRTTSTGVAARWLTRLLGGAGIAVASYGVVMFLRDAGLPWLLAILGSVLIEGSIARFALEVYRATRAGEDASTARRYVRLAVAASAAANVLHAPTGSLLGALLFATFPLFGAAVVEFDANVLARQRSGPSGQAGRAASFTRLASAAVARLWAYLAAALGLDVDARDTDVERGMRIRKAGRLMYALQVADARGGWFAERRARRLEVRAQRARAAAGVPQDVAAHRAVLAHMRMLAATRAEARDLAPFEPWTPALAGPGGADAAPDGSADGQRASTRTGRRTGRVSSARTGEAADRRVTSTDMRTDQRTNTRTNTRTSGRTDRRPKRRTGPDVTDLIPLGQTVYRELHEADEPLTRDRFTSAVRERGHSISGDRASALWRAVSNGHAPALD